MERLMKGEEVDIDLKDPEVQAAATKIQASFRGHKAREDVKKKKDEEAAAIKIQASFRGHQARERVKDIKLTQSQEMMSESATGVEADVVGDDSTTLPEEANKLEEDISRGPEEQEASVHEKLDETEGAGTEAVPVEPEVMEPAAEGESEVPDRQEAEGETEDVTNEGGAGDVQVQEAAEPGEEKVEDSAETAEEKAEDAGERGDGAADVQQPGEAQGGEVEGEAEEVDLDLNDPELHSAAVKIQASFRGHKVREGVKTTKSSESLPQEPQGEGGETSEEKPDEEKKEETEGDKDGEPSVPEGAEESKPSED